MSAAGGPMRDRRGFIACLFPAMVMAVSACAIEDRGCVSGAAPGASSPVPIERAGNDGASGSLPPGTSSDPDVTSVDAGMGRPAPGPPPVDAGAPPAGAGGPPSDGRPAPTPGP